MNSYLFSFQFSVPCTELCLLLFSLLPLVPCPYSSISSFSSILWFSYRRFCRKSVPPDLHAPAFFLLLLLSSLCLFSCAFAKCLLIVLPVISVHFPSPMSLPLQFFCHCYIFFPLFDSHSNVGFLLAFRFICVCAILFTQYFFMIRFYSIGVTSTSSFVQIYNVYQTYQTHKFSLFTNIWLEIHS